jgi:hypothetical protein
MIAQRVSAPTRRPEPRNERGMTSTARVIAEMEAADNSAEQARIQAEFPTDAVFRDVLALTYDCYEQFDAPPDLADPDPISAPANVNAALDSTWVEFATCLRGGVPYHAAAAGWNDSPAWPVFERVLRKHFVGVSFATVNGVWGTLPTFEVADVSSAPITFPCYAIPCVSRERRFLLVRNHCHGALRVHMFDEHGTCGTSSLPARLLEQLRAMPWRRWFAASRFADGIVLDGWLDDERAAFHASDCVPLAQFEQQKLTAPFRKRIADLDLADAARARGLRVAHRRWLPNQSALAGSNFALLARSNGRGVIAVDPDAPFGYRDTSVRRWIHRPSFGCGCCTTLAGSRIE